MQATDILVEEHGWIQRMLLCLERLIDDAREREQVDGPTAGELLALFETFADGRHQRKEEEFLFPRLMAQASSTEGKYIERLHGDHANEARRMLGMRSNVLGAIHGEPLCLREFLRVASDYVSMHRRHMTNESVVLFPMAGRLLTALDDAEIVDGFARIDGTGNESRSRSFERIARLCERLGVPIQQEDAPYGSPSDG